MVSIREANSEACSSSPDVLSSARYPRQLAGSGGEADVRAFTAAGGFQDLQGGEARTVQVFFRTGRVSRGVYEVGSAFSRQAPQTWRGLRAERPGLSLITIRWFAEACRRSWMLWLSGTNSACKPSATYLSWSWATEAAAFSSRNSPDELTDGVQHQGGHLS